MFSFVINSVQGLGFGNYKAECQSLIEWLRENGFDLSLETFQAWLDLGVSQGLAASTVHKRFFAVKHLFRHLIIAQTGGSEEDFIALDYHLKKINRPQQNYNSVGRSTPTAEEVRRLLRNTGVRASLMIEFIVETGLRVSELCGARWANLRKIGTGIHALRILGKGKKERSVIISESLRRRIRHVFGHNVFLFETKNKTEYQRYVVHSFIYTATRRVFGNSFSPHSLRRAWTTIKLASGASLEAVSRYLGHSDQETTLRYYAGNTLPPEEAMVHIHRKGKSRGR
jgi:integrase